VKKIWITILAYSILMVTGLFIVNAQSHEYVIILDRTDTPHPVQIGVISAGLSKSQAEGLALQLTRDTFAPNHISVVAHAFGKIDINNYHPKP